MLATQCTLIFVRKSTVRIRNRRIARDASCEFNGGFIFGKERLVTFPCKISINVKYARKGLVAYSAFCFLFLRSLRGGNLWLAIYILVTADYKCTFRDLMVFGSFNEEFRFLSLSWNDYK